MNESKFQQEIKNSLIDDGHWCFKIPDAIRSKETRFTPVKPYDLHATIDGLSIAIECKMLHDKPLERFNLDMLLSAKEKKFKLKYSEGNQYRSLLKNECAGGLSFVFLNHRTSYISSILYIIPMDNLDVIDGIGTDRKAMTEHLKNYCYYGTGHKGLFNLKEFYIWL